MSWSWLKERVCGESAFRVATEVVVAGDGGGGDGGGQGWWRWRWRLLTLAEPTSRRVSASGRKLRSRP